MKGLELSKLYFERYGMPMLKENFPGLLPYIAAGLAGSGSEVLGFDDEISADHDFEPGFCIFLPGEDVLDRRTAFQLERAYAQLPESFMGCSRSKSSPVGGARHGVIRTSDFLLRTAGTPDGKLDTVGWLSVPEQSLAEVTGGEIFYDAYGEVSAAREALSYFPEDIRKKKLAGQLLLAAQSGQYNYPRCVRRADGGAAQLSLFEFVNAAMASVFLLNRRYMPYYKWRFRALRELPRMADTAEPFEFLLSRDNSDGIFRKKSEIIDSTARELAEELFSDGLTGRKSGELERAAYSVNEKISDPEIRNMNIFAAV